MEQKTQVEEIEIPQEIVVFCPLLAGQIAKVVNCVGCEHFHGLQCRSTNAEIAFESRYRVLCRHPNALDLFRMKG